MARFEFLFRLSKPAPTDLVDRRVGTSVGYLNISLPRGKRELRVWPITGPDKEAAHLDAVTAVNEFLNYIFSRIQYAAQLDSSYRWSDLDNPGTGGTVIHVEPLSWFAGRMVIGRRLRLPRDQRGSAYMRAGDMAISIFDKFRNFYLAVDWVGKQIRPTGSDRTLLADTLSTVTSQRILRSLYSGLSEVIVPAGVTLTGHVIQDISVVLYRGFRCALMHAGDQSDFPPFNPRSTQQVGTALRTMRSVAWQYVKYERVHFP